MGDEPRRPRTFGACSYDVLGSAVLVLDCTARSDGGRRCHRRPRLVEVVDQPLRPGFLVDYDPIFYHQQANSVADGRGFIAPYVLDDAGRGPTLPSAGHPPLLVVVLALASKLGLRSFHADRLVVALLGAGLVPLVGLLAARLGGRACGVIAAVIVAVYPNFWLYDALLMPEVLAGLLVAASLLVVYRLLDVGDDTRRSGGLGGAPRCIDRVGGADAR